MITGQSTSNTAIIMSFVILILLDVLIISNMKDKSIDGLFFVDTLGSILFTFMGWMPVFTGTVLALIFAIIGASLIRDKFMGK